MRKLAVVLALASTALATPALARDKSWYVGIEGGAMIVEDIDYDIGALNNAGSVDHDYGYDVDAVMGYDFGGFRLETEVGYRKATVDGYSSTTTTPAFTGAGALVAVPAGNYDYAGGSSSALSFMLNGLLDFGPDDGIQGFVGGGVGVARVKANYALNDNGSFLNDSDTVFAYQGLAGIRAPLTDHIDATLKYRFFNAENVKLVDNTNRVFDGRYRSHSILGGVTYNFGAPAEPMAPPPPPPAPEPMAPPPPPAPVEVVCSPGPFIVFFEWDKSDITPEAASILDNAVTQYQSCGNAQVMLAGHADKSGSASYNVGLSQRRADGVRAYLSSHAIPDGVISTEAFGESRPRVDTADGVREVQNRRVEVTYGPGSGQ
ncbi:MULTISPECIES: OmpA family protein [unclassified Sphingomonas]|jgi:OOP family OmpA-OmpF porin|uniref:OmpA family protein n=1 Tax=unclassified Sphingomonas TaxID=196159 RepID=UPI0006FA17D1|nr:MULTISPECIES: OmpA family protein [unclassified Sphingomonas]KQN21909.1 flagellar motor protein MotB [Sphingomonas sp. Leaf30]MBD8551723.1 OmpA family protein [Sphingomonas sp. CFBP 8764]MBD8736015.1 OmpA family protein [Sphingomonas sp. CFBP 13706]